MGKGLFLKYISSLLCLGWLLSFGVKTSLSQNLPPVFDPIANCFVSKPDSENPQLSGGYFEGNTFFTCYVSERETLEVFVHATDPDGDSLKLSVLNVPPTAMFSDLGNGRASVLWIPEYVGPQSSAKSPFEVFFVASDESLSSRLRVVINVKNVNRNPELILPESSEVAVGSQLVFQVRATDLDLEEVSLQALNAPSGASFEPGSGMFRWIPQLTDTGLKTISFRATDLSGGECVGETHILVVKPSTFSLSLGVKESILGSVVDVPIKLVNSDPIGGMELLVKFDPTEFTFLGASRQGCRTEKWEYFVCREKDIGFYRVIKIVGIADFPNQVPVTPLLADSGVIVNLSFRVTTDPYLNGLLLPLEFSSFDFTDNTFSTPRGKFIPQEKINKVPGGVWLNPDNTLIGDINQNGLPFEIADAVRLAAYFSGRATLTPQQMINSDVNQDGRMAALSDLIYLINRILHQQTVPGRDTVTSDESVVVKIKDDDSGKSIWLDSDPLDPNSDAQVSGAVVVFKGESLRIENVKLSSQAQGLELHTSLVGKEFRVLIISPDAKPLPEGDSPLFSFEGEGYDSIQISLASPEGELLGVKQQYEHNSLPTKYELYQNYPNPFNPETNIKYFVGGDALVHVSLKIYNVVGQMVKTLVDEEQSPGEYNRVWSGKNENSEEVASGVYFYKLKVSDYVETKKMVLLR